MQRASKDEGSFIGLTSGRLHRKRIDSAPKRHLTSICTTKATRVYRDQLRVPAYFWFDPFDLEDRAGFVLRDHRYVPVQRDADGSLVVAVLGLKLTLWPGEIGGIATTWLRWADQNGLLPLPVELEGRRADAERERADAERLRAEEAEQELARLRALLAQHDNPSPKAG